MKNLSFSGLLRVLRFYFLISVIAQCSSAVSAQTLTTHGPPGGYILQVAQSEHYLFAATLNGLYRSSDGGQNWLMLREATFPAYWYDYGVHLPNPISRVAAHGQHVIFIPFVNAGNLTVWVSDDEGDTWNPAPNAGFPVYDPQGFGQLEATASGFAFNSNEGLFRSEDWGGTWEKSTVTDSLPFNTGLLYTDGADLFMQWEKTMFARNPATGQWEKRPLPVSANTAFEARLTVHPAVMFCHTSLELFSSYDAGKTWSAHPEANDLFGSKKIAIRNGEVYLWNSTNKTLFCKTTVQALNFTQRILLKDHPALHEGFAIAGFGNLFFSRGDSPVYWQSNSVVDWSRYYGLFRSSDGETWTKSDKGIASAIISDLRVLNNRLYAGAHDGLYRLGNATAAWESLQSSFYLQSGAVTYDNRLWSCGDSLFSSADDGATWTPENQYCTRLFSTGKALFNLIYQQMWRSTDGGQSWTNLNSAFDFASVVQLEVLDSTLYLLTNNKKVYQSVDQGDTWINLNAPFFGFVERLLATPDGIYEVHSEDVNDDYYFLKIYRYDEDNSTWTPLPAGPQTEPGSYESFFYPRVYDFIAHQNFRFMAVPRFGVYFSQDNGASWKLLLDDDIGKSARFLEVFDNNLFIAGLANSVRRIPLGVVSAPEHSGDPAVPLHLFPNPATGTVFLRLPQQWAGAGTIDVSDAAGRVVFTEKLSGNPLPGLPCSHLAPGVYTVVVRLENGTRLSGRFLKI